MTVPPRPEITDTRVSLMAYIEWLERELESCEAALEQREETLAATSTSLLEAVDQRDCLADHLEECEAALEIARAKAELANERYPLGPED